MGLRLDYCLLIHKDSLLVPQEINHNNHYFQKGALDLMHDLLRVQKRYGKSSLYLSLYHNHDNIPSSLRCAQTFPIQWLAHKPTLQYFLHQYLHCLITSKLYLLYGSHLFL